MGLGLARGSVKKEWSAYLRFIEEYILREQEQETVTGVVVSAIARNGVISRRELVELAENVYRKKSGDADPRGTIRVILHYLRDAGLVYVRKHCRKCYVVSMLWLFFVESIVGDKWVEWLRRRATDISQKEVRELRKWIELSKLSDREIEKLGGEDRELARKLKRVRRLVEWRLETLKHMAELIRVVNDILPDKCFKPLIEHVRESLGGVYSAREAVVAPIGRWYLECYALILYEYIPFLLKLLAGMAYSYATGHSIKRYVAGIRRTTRHWLEVRCHDDYCSEHLRKLVSETVSRLVNLVEHLLQSAPKSFREFIEEHRRELEDRGAGGQEIDNSVSTVGKFLLETLREFYVWTPLILYELQAFQSVSNSHRI